MVNWMGSNLYFFYIWPDLKPEYHFNFLTRIIDWAVLIKRLNHLGNVTFLLFMTLGICFIVSTHTIHKIQVIWSASCVILLKSCHICNHVIFIIICTISCCKQNLTCTLSQSTHLFIHFIHTCQIARDCKICWLIFMMNLDSPYLHVLKFVLIYLLCPYLPVLKYFEINFPLWQSVIFVFNESSGIARSWLVSLVRVLFISSAFLMLILRTVSLHVDTLGNGYVLSAQVIYFHSTKLMMIHNLN